MIKYHVMDPNFIVPGFPLYTLGGVLCLLYVCRFFVTRRSKSPTNYTFLGKAFAWGLLAGLYLWASVTGEHIITVRNYVRLGVLLLMTTYTAFMALELWLETKYK